MARKGDHGLPSKEDNVREFWKKGNTEKIVELYNKESPAGDRLVVEKPITYCIPLKEEMLNEKGQAWHFCKVGRTKGTFEKRRGALKSQIPQDIGTSFQISKGPGINDLTDNQVETIVRKSLGWPLTVLFAKDKGFPCPSEWIIVPAKFLSRVKRSSNSLTGSYFRERNRFHEFLNEELNLLSNQEFKEYPGKFLGEIENIRIRFPVPKTAYLQNNGKVREANKKTNPLKGKCAPKKRVSSNFVNEKRTERGPSPGVQGIPSKKGKFISNKTTNENSLSEKTPLIPVQPSISHLRIPKKSQTVRTPEHTHIPNSYYDSKELSNSREEHGKRSVPNRKKQLELQDSDEGQNVNNLMSYSKNSDKISQGRFSEYRKRSNFSSCDQNNGGKSEKERVKTFSPSSNARKLMNGKGTHANRCSERSEPRSNEHGKQQVVKTDSRANYWKPPPNQQSEWIQSNEKGMPREDARPVQTPSTNKELTVEKERLEPFRVQKHLQYHQKPTLQHTFPYQAPSYETNYNHRNEHATETTYQINNSNRQLGIDQNDRYGEPFGQFQRPTTTMELKQEVNIHCRMTQSHSYNPVPFHQNTHLLNGRLHII